MNCCTHCEATESIFDIKSARKSLKRYLDKGPDKTTSYILNRIHEQKDKPESLLDIGGGVGVVHHELLGKGIDSAFHVDASSASIRIAQEEDQLRDQQDRVRYLFGDATLLSREIPNADLVTLDRVICCYPLWESLLQVSASKANKLIALSVPRDRWYVKMVFAMDNAFRQIRGNEFRAFVHSTSQMYDKLANLGFHKLSTDTTLTWEVSVFTRNSE